uniref:Chromosome 15 open reading frame 39 n=1 Tax=Athene cunicularia TaxID=194338 RepID=A0A663MD49_ATHCN
MASKRHLESLDPVIFNKLPRLETEPAAGFPASLCKSIPVPNPGSENHFNYKGSYFACPLQSPDVAEQPLARWSPAAAYPHYSTGAGSQPVPAEGPLASCLLYRPESLGTALQPLGTEKGKDSLMRELLMKPVAVNKVAPLAVPKPVYRAPACFVDPRMALPLGPRAESLQQRPGDADWALPAATPASHPLHPGEPHSSTGLHKRGPHSDPSLPPLHPSLVLPTKEKVAYRERPTVCYPPTHYPLSLHKAALLYHPPAPTMDTQPSTLPGAYKGFGFVGSEEPFPGSYLKPQAPRSYFPSPLDSYMPRAAGAGALASPPAKSAALPRDAEPPRRAGYLPSPGFAFSPGDPAVFGTSFAGTKLGYEQHQAENPRRQAMVRHNSAFQPVCAPEKVPGGSGGLAQTFAKGEGSWEKPSPGKQEPPYPGRRKASPAPQETPRGGPLAPIIVGKGDACKAKEETKELIPSSPSASPTERLKDLRNGEASPSSPPMPVINNVFSLAPYRDYLEGTEGPAQVPFCRERVPKKPKLLPREPGSQKSNPGGVGSGEPAPEDMVLDLSLKKRLVKAGETLGPIGCKEGPEEKAGVGEGAKPQALPLLLEVGSGDKSNFQSSATFMFKKFKILRSLPPSTVPPQQPSSTCAPQPSPPQPAPSSSTPVTLLPRTHPTSPPASSPLAPQPGPQPSTSALRGARPDPQQPPLPEAPHVLGEESISLPGPFEVPGPQTSAGQYFTTLHSWLCDVISCSVSRSSPELLQEWLKKATKGKEIWLAFQDVAALLTNLLSQLETFMFARKCPFPHVVRAGAVFIPIHVVKEKLFPKLPGVSVDQVLQEHKVELRPTTLSEERHLRDLELKSCSSRMLKLLALKQLPDIYPDLLNLHWHNSIKQQLGR